MPPQQAPITLRIAGQGDRELLRGWMRSHLLVLATWNPTVDVDAPFDEQWFQKPGVLFPWIVEVDREAAGFALMGNHRLAAAMGAPGDYYFHEFHIAHALRRRGVGQRAVELLLEQHAGSWTLDVLPANGPAIAFWERALAARGVQRRNWIDEDGVQFVRLTTDG